MTRRNISKKRFPKRDFLYNSYLVSFLISRILKSGKKNLAKQIVYKTFTIIEKKTKKDPLYIFEQAVYKARPEVGLKSRRVGGSTRQVPIQIQPYRSTTLALRWMVSIAKKRKERGFCLKLANEIIDTSKNFGGTIKKKEETIKMAKANKAYSHLRY